MNLPNRITLTRFILAIVMIVIYSLKFIPNFDFELGQSNITILSLICCIIFVIASISDFLDGYIARSRNLVTDFGKFMDPLADKFLVDAALILLSIPFDFNPQQYYIYPFITVLFIGRDLAVDGLRMLATSKGKVLAANIYGKIKTALQMIVIPIIFLNGFPFSYLGMDSSGYYPYTYIITNCLISLALIASLVSCVIYFVQNRHVFDKE